MYIMMFCEILERKRLVVWFSSHCRAISGRDAYVRALEKHINVSGYGACNKLECPKSQGAKCRKIVKENYKFYLSFENSVCPDYVTEKFFDRYLDLVVPVVLNREIHQRLAPGDSFIAADDFESPKMLARYLKFLDENPLEYLKYFKWRREFTVKRVSDQLRILCNLCRKLTNEPLRKKTYPDVIAWLNSSSCKMDGT